MTAISALVLLIVFPYSLWFPSAQYDAMSKALELKTVTTGRMAALSLSASLDFEDRESASTYLEAVVRFGNKLENHDVDLILKELFIAT